jgi:hypothetical protein
LLIVHLIESFFDWSRDGKDIAVARGNATRDVVLIKDLQSFRYAKFPAHSRIPFRFPPPSNYFLLRLSLSRTFYAYPVKAGEPLTR